MAMRKKTQDPMQLSDFETAFYDFYKTCFPKYRHNNAVREIAKASFFAGAGWRMARQKFDIEADIKEFIEKYS